MKTETAPAPRDDRVIARYLEAVPNVFKECAGDLVSQWRHVRPLLPAFCRDQQGALLLSALRYLRRIDGKIEKQSIIDAVLMGAQYGLPIDGQLGHALPFDEKDKSGKTVVFVPDYKGLIAVAKGRGLVRDVRPYVVHESDEFEPPRETPAGVEWTYREELSGDRGACIGAVAILEFTDDRPAHLEWMRFEELERVRKSAKTQKVWNAWPDEMRKKSVVRRAFKTRRFDASFSALLAEDSETLYDEDIIEVKDGKPVVKKSSRARKPPREVKAKPPPAAPVERREEAPPEEPPTEGDYMPGEDEARAESWKEFEHLKTYQFADDELDEIHQVAGVDRVSPECSLAQLEAALYQAEVVIARRRHE